MVTFQSVSEVCFGFQHSVAGAPGFEGPGLLQVLALEEELEAGEGVKGLAGEDGGAMDVLLDAGVGSADLGEGQLSGGGSRHVGRARCY